MSELPSGWSKQPLSALVEKIIDYRGKTPKKLGLDWSENGKYRALSAKTVKTGGLVNEEQINLGDEELYNKWMKDEIEYNDILLTSEAPMGEVLIWKSDEKIILSQRLFAIRIKENISADYIYYYFISKRFQSELLARASGTTVIGIKQTELLKTNLILPKYDEQKAIADILSSFDNKIALLKEQNSTLETMASAIFKEWFVDFNYPDATGEMVESEMGLIPKGWRVGKIGEIVDIYDSKRIPLSSKEREEIKGHYPYYGATKIMDYINDYIFDGTYLLFAEDGSVIDNNDHPILQYVWGKFWVNNHTHILQGKNGFSTESLYVMFKDINVSSIVTGAVQLKINQTNLLNFNILIPDSNSLYKFNHLIKPIFQKIKNNSAQIQTLANTRDTLLPKLISGEKRLKDFK
jgi:type I restriction enzyme S subunit